MSQVSLFYLSKLLPPPISHDVAEKLPKGMIYSLSLINIRFFPGNSFCEILLLHKQHLNSNFVIPSSQKTYLTSQNFYMFDLNEGLDWAPMAQPTDKGWTLNGGNQVLIQNPQKYHSE